MMTASDFTPGVYQSLTPDDWRAYESSLKGLLKVREPPLLFPPATEAAATLHQIQILIIHRAWRWPLRHLPLMLCRGPARSGANFLRWRNQQNNRSGTPAWQALIQDGALPHNVRTALRQIEQDRILFNMQMSLTAFHLRQIRECTDKFAHARITVQSHSPITRTEEIALWLNED